MLFNFITAKKMVVAITPRTKNNKTALICSAVLAASATLRPANRMPSIIISMPMVISGPGRTRAIQSNNSKGTKGRSIHLSSRYMSATSGAVNNTPASTPAIKPKFLRIFTSCPAVLSCLFMIPHLPSRQSLGWHSLGIFRDLAKLYEQIDKTRFPIGYSYTRQRPQRLQRHQRLKTAVFSPITISN